MIYFQWTENDQSLQAEGWKVDCQLQGAGIFFLPAILHICTQADLKGMETTTDGRFEEKSFSYEVALSPVAGQWCWEWEMEV